MKTVIALCVAASAAFFTPAHAETMTVREGKNTITISSDACPDSVTKDFKPEFKDRFRAAYGTLEGKSLKGCWTLAGADFVHVILNGVLYEVPAALFKNNPGV